MIIIIMIIIIMIIIIIIKLLVIVIGPSRVQFARVISKSDEREARGRFEITSTITP